MPGRRQHNRLADEYGLDRLVDASIAIERKAIELCKKAADKAKLIAPDWATLDEETRKIWRARVN